MRKLFTSESVTEGHPDKICDQISDSILDAILREDPNARVACECSAGTGLILLFGEISTSANIDYAKVARQTIIDIGYDRAKYGFDGNTCGVLNAIGVQSPDIAIGVNDSYENKGLTGAGDQGIMFGFACDETPELMPLPIMLAHKLAIQLAKVRKDGTLRYLRPDGKTQVTVEYDENDRPVRIDAIVVSTQHSPDVTIEQVREDVKELVIDKVLEDNKKTSWVDEDTKIFINPTGRFVIGGPQGDAGLTGRKIVVDTYGGYSRVGGGCFSGKDPTKVDRSASYGARYIAKNIVATGLASKCEIQLSYAIGVAEPVSIRVDTFGTGKVAEDENSEMQHVVLRAFGDESCYLRDLPIHHSQREVAQGEGYVDFELYLHITKELSGFILSRGKRLKVISPKSYAKEIAAMK